MLKSIYVSGMASIDLSAAYDMVSRESLFKKLYNLGKYLVKICVNYNIIYYLNCLYNRDKIYDI